jgi:hypothetical protein
MKKLATLQFSDFTEREFTDFVTKIRGGDYRTEAQHDDAIYHFARITGHPDGWDLIYHPEPGADHSTSGIIATIRQWRAKNGKPDFRQE